MHLGEKMNEQSKLHEVVSNLAKKFEEEKKAWEEALEVKNTEIEAFKKELDKCAGQQKDNENQIKKTKENKEFTEAENAALKAEIIEVKNAQKKETEEKEKKWKEEMEQMKQSLIDDETKAIEQLFNEERLKWREKLRK